MTRLASALGMVLWLWRFGMRRTWDVTRVSRSAVLLLLVTGLLAVVPSCGCDCDCGDKCAQAIAAAKLEILAACKAPGSAPGEGYFGRFRLLNRSKLDKVEAVEVERQVHDPMGNAIWEPITGELNEAPWPMGHLVDAGRGHMGHFDDKLDAALGVRVRWKMMGAVDFVDWLEIDMGQLGGMPRAIKYVIVTLNEDQEDGKGRLLLLLDDKEDPPEVFEAHH